MNHKTITRLSIGLFVAGLVWGLYTLMVYMGVPVHALVYLKPDEAKTIGAACGEAAAIGVYLCRGTALIFPFISTFLKMLSPFYAYIVISLLAYAGYLLYTGVKTGYFSFNIRLRPVMIIAAFALSIWLIGTTLSFSSLTNAATPDGTPFRRFYEPTAEAYPNAGEQAVKELKNNFNTLLERGCLSPILIDGQPAATQGGTKVYNLSPLCIQQSLLSRAGAQFLMVLLFLFNLLIAGTLVLRLVKVPHLNRAHELIFALGLGALMWVAVLWALAIAGFLQSTLVRLLFFGLPFAAFPISWYWLKAAWRERVDVSGSFSDVRMLLVWLLVSYLALNFLNVVRPFPIGWDDLGSYLNRPRLLASYGSFIPSISQFQWEYVTSLGFVIFGFESFFGANFAMLINWAAGLLSVLVLFVFGRTYFGPRMGVLAAIIYYFLPMTGHFSFADMKIDNALFFISSLATFAACLALFPRQEETDHPHAHHDTHAHADHHGYAEQHAPADHHTSEHRTSDHRHPPRSPGVLPLVVIAGLLCAFAFAIKPTAILSMLMIFMFLVSVAGDYHHTHEHPVHPPRSRGGVPLLFAGSIFLSFAILSKFGPLRIDQIAERAAIGANIGQTVLFVVSALIGVALIGFGIYRSRHGSRLLLLQIGKNLIAFGIAFTIGVAPWMIFNGIHNHSYTIASFLKANDNTLPQFVTEPQSTSTLAFDPQTPVRYLPDDLKLDPEHPACKTSAKVEELDRYWGFNTGISHYLTLPWRQVMNIDAFGYYVTLMPALLLYPLLLLLPYFWSKPGRWLRFLFAGSIVFLIQWMFVGNGVMWYGLGMFLMFALGLEALIVHAPDKPNRILFSSLLTASILICLVNRLWQFDAQKNLFEYPLGKVTATTLREMTIPHYDDITNQVLERNATMPDMPYTYRMGTFISYFIPRNREIIPIADHQLTMFNCLNQERNHPLTLKRLQALGFNGLIFDTNTATIEKDQNGSLHQKVNAFTAFANDTSIGLNPVIIDTGQGIAYFTFPELKAVEAPIEEN